MIARLNGCCAEMKRIIAYRREESSKSNRDGISIFLLLVPLTKMDVDLHEPRFSLGGRFVVGGWRHTGPVEALRHLEAETRRIGSRGGSRGDAINLAGGSVWMRPVLPPRRSATWQIRCRSKCAFVAAVCALVTEKGRLAVAGRGVISVWERYPCAITRVVHCGVLGI